MDRARTALERGWPWLLIAVGALLPLARVALDPFHSLPGAEESDIYKHAWSFWHTPAALLEGTWPWTRFLNGPGGGVLLDVMLVPSLLMAPVALLAGPAFSANLWVGASIFGVGAATWLLSRSLVESRVGAVAAALVAQTSPFLLGYPLASGVHERLAVWVFPVVLLSLLRVRDGGGWRWTLAGTLALVGATLGCQVYAVFTAAAVLMMVPVLLRAPGGTRPALRRLLPTGLAMGLALAAVYTFVAWASNHAWSLAPQPGRVDLLLGTKTTGDVATLGLLLDPATARAQVPREVGDLLHRVVYLGAVPGLSALAGGLWAAWRRHWDLVAVVAVGFAFALLSLGATFQVGGTTLSNPLNDLLAEVIPVYGAVPPRWQQVGAFGPLSAVGIAALVNLPRRPRLQWLLAGLLVAGTLAERALALPVPLVAWTTTARVPAIYAHVDGDGVLMDIPRVWRGRDLSPGMIFFAQTEHHQPIPASINLGSNDWDTHEAVRTGRGGDWGALARRLRQQGMRWVVVHPDWFGDDVDPDRCIAGLTGALGPPVAVADGDALWDLSVLAGVSVDLAGEPPNSGVQRRPR